MADAENTSMRDAQNDAEREFTSEAGETLVPEETWTQEDAPLGAEPVATEQTPFRDDQLLFFEGDLMRNELADAQSDPEAARSLAARHWSRLLYDPNLPWRGRAPYPQVSMPKPGKQTL
jgi:hypothetical protein